MAATLGATLSDIKFPLRHTNLGPFKSSGASFYAVVQDTTLLGQVRCVKASDPMTAFTSPAANKTMSSTSSTAIEAMAAYQVADVIHIATQIATGAVYYNSFNMATDAWTLGTSELAVAAATQPPTTGATFVDLVVRASGEVVFVYCAGQTAMSSTFNMVRYRRRTGVATYQTAVNVDNGGSVDWANGVAAIGASDRVHFFLRSNTGATLYQRTLSAANALEATATNIASPGAGAMHRNYALSYVDGATTKVRNSFQGATRVEVAKLDSTDTPTVTVETASDNISYNLVASVQYQQYLAIDPASLNLHLIYSRTSTQDLLYDYSTGGGGAWGTDTTELAATINHITANVYDRGGAGTKLAMVLDDAGTVKYAEIALAAGPVSVAMDAAAATLGASVATLDVPGGVTPSLIWNHYRPLHTLTSR